MDLEESGLSKKFILTHFSSYEDLGESDKSDRLYVAVISSWYS